MAICQVMIADFMHGWNCRYDDRGTELYSDDDLHTGLQYADNLIEFEGLTHEPLHGYDLVDFKRWCKRKLSGER